MFRKNTQHKQEELFNSFTGMNPKVQKSMQGTWAPLFYEHVFFHIDETPFAVLYSSHNGRPNFPINILLSLEFIKHMKDYTDEEILEQFHFNFQVMYALGIRNLGEVYLAERTLYEFRRRLYEYTISHPEQEDLIFRQFRKLTEHFMTIAGIASREQPMDSTQVQTNIKLAGRLSLAFDVVEKAVRECPAAHLPEALKPFAEPGFRNQFLYRCKTKETLGRIQEMLNQCALLLDIAEAHPESLRKETVALLQRFLQEQATYHAEKKQWIAKANKDIAADAIQSAHDPDVTYRKKGRQGYVGLVANVAETCANENPVQMITHYQVEKNSVSDTELLTQSMETLKKETGLTDLYVDGAYFSSKTEELAQENHVCIHYTNMTGRERKAEKLPVLAFTFDNNKAIVSCPACYNPLDTSFDEKRKVLIAEFERSTCQECPMQPACPVKIQSKKATVTIKQSSILAAQARERTMQIKKERLAATSKRAAIEGSISSIKRGQGAGRLRVRGIVKATLVFGMKVLGHNFRQLFRCFKKGFCQKLATIYREEQGISAPI
ncbi:conserved hypothetical protein [Heliomicrobium modesticaldum Ice1]|uniref:Transposase n=1 Tax=Heliobacterium modesticaldum (strain ATCC 51547 / Ice1) TaxID=498761 RepID=B0THJ1_HELMI|nr:transposase [Heliomicrobium modesticaldum]ABZ83429.1 conserved hypothetical protein [Heliomicrobium modesticaldum Ice1]